MPIMLKMPNIFVKKNLLEIKFEKDPVHKPNFMWAIDVDI